MANTNDYKNLFKQSGLQKRLLVSFPRLSVILRNEDIVAESMEISESLCSGTELRFGSCEASVFKLRVIGNVIPLFGETCVVSIQIGENDPYSLGTYKVASDKPTADRRYRDIIAYDAMDEIINAEMAEWYYTILPQVDSATTLGAFRESFVSHFGLEQEEITLPNDEMVVTRTLDTEELSGKDVLSAICELNGCFGHIGRNGKMQYITLKEISEGVYPSDELYPSDDLFPGGTEIVSKQQYKSCTYEDFTTKRIGKLQIRQEENDVGAIIGAGENCYIVDGNFLTFGKDSTELTAIAQKLFDVISAVWYRPASVQATGNPCLEVGTGYKVNTMYETIETYILKRTLKGIQSLSDSYESQGVEKYVEEVNSVQKQILRIKGKMNTLIRTVDETTSELRDVEQDLSSRISQTATSISAEVRRAKEAEASLSIRADEIATSVSDVESRLSTKITQTASAINLSVSNLEEAVYTDISVMQNEIQLRTTQGMVSSMISVALDEIVISSSQIRLEGYTTINGGFSVDTAGNVTISGTSAIISMVDNTFQVASKMGGGVTRIGNSFMTFYDSNYIDTYPIARLSGTKMIMGDGYCTVDCGTIDCSGDLKVSTINGYIPVSRNEFTALRERVAVLETKVGEL